MTNTLDKPARKVPRARIKHTHKTWSPERRAKQAELIRNTKPWLKSTGPRTEDGKTRSAANALMHGFRSRTFAERVREERQLIRDAVDTIALAKAFLRLAAACSVRAPRGRSIVVWTGDPELDGPLV